MSISYQIGNAGPVRHNLDLAALRLERLLSDYRRTEAALIASIEAEEHITHHSDPSDPRYSMLARSMRNRLDNLRATIAKLAAELARHHGLSDAA
jgi:hypothetical protein